MKNRILSIFGVVALLVGIGLTGVNVYGLFRDVRPANLEGTDTRFHEDLTMDFDQSMTEIIRKSGESEEQYAERVTNVISKSLAHIHWKEETDNTRFNQLIPIWENYFLYFMGIFSGIPEYQRYHYADYERSLRRGIGICGDASMIMSQLLDQNNIPNQILTFPGHVVVAASFDGGRELTYDPDFGVFLPYSPDSIQQSPVLVREHYAGQGYTEKEINTLNWLYGKDYQRWNGVSHFITKKYYFEKVSYWLKWPFPFVLIACGLFFVLKRKSMTPAKNAKLRESLT